MHNLAPLSFAGKFPDASVVAHDPPHTRTWTSELTDGVDCEWSTASGWTREFRYRPAYIPN